MLSQIDGVLTFPVVSIPDERGCVWKVHEAPFVVQDVYVTTVRQGAIKAWHGYQTKQIYYTVLKGTVKLVLWDARAASFTVGVYDELFLGDDSRFSILIPPMVYAGFKGIGDGESIIMVQASEKYKQIYRLAYNELEYDWGIKHG